MQVIRDAILEPPYKRRSMYVLLVTIVKQVADRCNFCVKRRDLWCSKSKSEFQERSLWFVVCGLRFVG